MTFKDTVPLMFDFIAACQNYGITVTNDVQKLAFVFSAQFAAHRAAYLEWVADMPDIPEVASSPQTININQDADAQGRIDAQANIPPAHREPTLIGEMDGATAGTSDPAGFPIMSDPNRKISDAESASERAAFGS